MDASSKGRRRAFGLHWCFEAEPLLLDDEAAILDVEQSGALGNGAGFFGHDPQLKPKRRSRRPQRPAGRSPVSGAEGRKTSTNPICSGTSASVRKTGSPRMRSACGLTGMMRQPCDCMRARTECAGSTGSSLAPTTVMAPNVRRMCSTIASVSFMRSP